MPRRPHEPGTDAMNKLILFAAAVVLLWTGATTAETGAHSAKAIAYIGWPNDGQVLPAGRPFRVWFGLRDMGVAPSHVQFPNTGHHHLLVDTDLPPLDQPIPSDRNHLHFGAGETETTLELPPGKHTLQLLMGDANHVPQNPPVYSKKITIYVK
ncbi:ATPase [Burkholderia ubonensis]|nr:ATPase [Burkholderia ubonensis]KVC77532.1 ATPase [Burkholderia ubonensis]KVD30701.1 ATPase [Burkholderia ubonensis]KVG73650.1 ATPase [Burkholderia ubonensis]KVH16834.1 ATPase [Burkholderia ubonensis]